jgi:predicted RNA-binding Zn-ribbon protein involved in translation (DUF1610 family)
MSIEVKCPRCGSPCSMKNRATNEYECAHCGSTFRFIDPNLKTVMHGTLAHNCPICGAPVKDGEGYICTECGKEWVCFRCVKKLKGRYVCNECFNKKMCIIGSSLSCPKCNTSLAYIARYNRWYCYTCSAYPTHVCPDCGFPMEYLPQYSAFYCHSCRKYPSSSSPTNPAQTTATSPAVIIGQQPVHTCSICGGALRYISTYGRWYCDQCRKYA